MNTLLAAALFSATLHVPADYPTIQAAVDAAAAEGDSILVAPGTYPEDVFIFGKIIALEGAPGAEVRSFRWDADAETYAGGSLKGFSVTEGLSGLLRSDFWIHNCRVSEASYIDNVLAMIDVRDSEFLSDLSVIAVTDQGGYARVSNCTIMGSLDMQGDFATVGASTVHGPTSLNGSAVDAGSCVFLGGVRLSGYAFYSTISSCTVSGSGIRLEADASVSNNIVFGCPVGMSAWFLADFSCNDVWDCGVAYEGVEDQTGMNGNIAADPLFCNETEYTLREDSPCLPGNHPDGWDCGQIGARGQGCEAPTAVEAATWGQLKKAYR